MTIQLDTHVWVWWSIDSPRLSTRHREVIDAGEPDGIAVSILSVWEVAMLAAKNRLDLGAPIPDWPDRISEIPTLHFLPITAQALVDSTLLPGAFHADRADRIIVATARAHQMALLTADRHVLDYPGVRTSDRPEGTKPPVRV